MVVSWTEFDKKGSCPAFVLRKAIPFLRWEAKLWLQNANGESFYRSLWYIYISLRHRPTPIRLDVADICLRSYHEIKYEHGPSDLRLNGRVWLTFTMLMASTSWSTLVTSHSTTLYFDYSSESQVSEWLYIIILCHYFSAQSVWNNRR